MSTSDTDRIVDKVKKLLALAEGAATDGERDAALAQVQRLLDRYQLDMGSIDQAAGDGCVESFVDSYSGRRPPVLTELLITILQQYFFVRAITERRPWADDSERLHLFGLRHNVEIAEYVYCFLARTFGDKWRDRSRATGCRKGMRSYFIGLAIAVCKTLDAERARRTATESTALVRCGHDVCRAMARRYGELETLPLSQSRQTDGQSLFAGLIDGANVRIRPALRAAEREQGKLFA